MYNTPGRFDDSRVRISPLPSLTHQVVCNDRLGITGSYQWDMNDKMRLSIDGLYSHFHNTSENDQLSPVGLNRNNTNATYNTSSGFISPATARTAYPGLCTPNAGSAIVPAQDCGQAMYGTTPAFATSRTGATTTGASVLGSAAVVPGGVSPTNANIFSVNPNELDPYGYYNNPNSSKGGAPAPHGQSLSDDFDTLKLGSRRNFFRPGSAEATRARVSTTAR